MHPINAPDEKLWRVVAKHFVAGVIIRDHKVVKAAPILKWAIGKRSRWLRRYCDGKGWRVEVIVGIDPSGL